MAAVSQRVTPGRHVCAVADDHAARGRMAAAWVREGLSTGERVLWVEPGDGELLAWLDEHEVAWREALAAGQLLRAEPADVVRLSGDADIPSRIAGARALTEQALADGYRGLRVGVETAVALEVMPDIATQLRLEAAWEAHTSATPMSLLCLYDPARYGPHLDHALTVHPREYLDGLVAGRVDDGEIHLAGELDVSNAARLEGFLAAAADAIGGDVTLRLDGVAFVDLVAATRLVALARAVAPRRVRLVAPPYPLRRIVHLAGWTDEFDLTEPVV